MKKVFKLIVLITFLMVTAIFGYNQYIKISERNNFISEISVYKQYDESREQDYFNYHKIHPTFDLERILIEVNEKPEEIVYHDSFFDLIKQPNRFECIKYYFKNKGVSINEVIVISEKQLLDMKYNEFLAQYLYLDIDGITIRKCVDYNERNSKAIAEDVIVICNKELLDIEYDEVLVQYLHLDLDGQTIRKCIEYSKKYSEIESEDVIKIITLGLENIEPSKQLLDLIYADFFMPTRVERYLKLYQKNSNYSPRQVVEIVNCDADQPFYTNTQPSDLSKGLLIINNKFNYLDKDYVPDDLVYVDERYSLYGARMNKIAYQAFIEMCEAARKDLLEIKIYGDNGYRSYNYQNQIYQYYVSAYGIKGADECSARAGFSEHQTGLAIDIEIYPLNGNTSYSYYQMYQWTKENCWEYGFIHRYQGGKEHLTGYQQEDWHYRYVGKEVALFIKEHDITFDEYYTYFVKGY